MIKAIAFFILLFIMKSDNSFHNKLYNGYLITIVPDDINDTHNANYYYFLPNKFDTINKFVSKDSIGTIYPEIERFIKEHGGERVANSSLENSVSDDFIKMMYFYYDFTFNRPKKNFYIRRQKRSKIYANRASFNATLQYDITNKQDLKLYIINCISLHELSKEERKELKSFF